jgi:hypothetical protein
MLLELDVVIDDFAVLSSHLSSRPSSGTRWAKNRTLITDLPIYTNMIETVKNTGKFQTLREARNIYPLSFLFFCNSSRSDSIWKPVLEWQKNFKRKRTAKELEEDLDETNPLESSPITDSAAVPYFYVDAKQLEDFQFLYKTFWGRRDRIKEHIKIYPFPVDPSIDDVSATCDPYDLNVPYPLGLRTLDLSIPFFKEDSPMLIRDEYPPLRTLFKA